MAEATRHTSGHERTDADAAPLARAAAVLSAILILTFFGVVVLYKVLSYYQPRLEEEPHPLAAARQVSAAPRLQIDPPRQKLELRAVEDHVLTTYDWVDRERGLVRIPVARAIEVLADRGLPVRNGPVETGATGAAP
ncbi:MAG: hypothetical protein ABIL09_08630 [Gemmatimonadota bacterium]